MTLHLLQKSKTRKKKSQKIIRYKKKRKFYINICNALVAHPYWNNRGYIYLHDDYRKILYRHKKIFKEYIIYQIMCYSNK